MNKPDLALNNQEWLICHKTKPNHIYLIYTNKPDLALNNQEWLICHKTKPNSFSLSLSHTHTHCFFHFTIYPSKL